MTAARDYLTSLLGRYGLESEIDWAMEQFESGASPDEILLGIEALPAFKQRFPSIENRRQQGLPPISVNEILEYETTARQIMRQAGLPQNFYDQPSDFVSLIDKDVSPTELAQRVALASEQVINAPAEVRQSFAELFGVQGDGALTSLFLDSERALPILEDQVRQAQVGGAAAVIGVEIGRDQIARLADLGVDFGAASQGFAQISQLAPLFRETASETTDLTESREGVGAAFGIDADASAALRSRQQRRQAEFNRGTGGAAGLGTAE